MSVWYDNENRTAYLSGGDVSYVLFRDDENHLLNLYWGPAVPNGSLSYDPADYMPFASFDLPLSLIPHEIPVCGRGWNGTPAVGLLNSEGGAVHKEHGQEDAQYDDHGADAVKFLARRHDAQPM